MIKKIKNKKPWNKGLTKETDERVGLILIGIIVMI